MLAAVDELGVTTAQGAYWAGRLTLCGQPDDLPVYDAAFAAYFGDGRAPVHRPRAAHSRPARLSLSLGAEPGADGQDEAENLVALSASAEEVLRHRDVAALT